jgi:hypothetical protein
MSYVTIDIPAHPSSARFRSDAVLASQLSALKLPAASCRESSILKVVLSF